MKNPRTNRHDHTKEKHTGMRAHDTTGQGDEVCMSGTKIQYVYTNTDKEKRQ